MKEAYIVSAVRTAVGRAVKGILKDTRAEELAATVIKNAYERVSGLKKEEVEDVILGCAFPEGTQGMNIARIASIMAGLPYSVPAVTINRFCSSGLQSIAIACERIMSGFSDVIIAGGVETMSAVPMGGVMMRPNPKIMEITPEVYTPMGNTAEIVAKRFNVTREVQDKFAYESHIKAVTAQKAGKFDEEIVPFEVKIYGKNETIIFKKDECPREDTTLEALSKLKPVFAKEGTVTAGNASPINDGAAAVVVMSGEKMRSLGLKPLLKFHAFYVVGIEPEIMGIAPSVAIPLLLEKTGKTLNDIDLFELNEAFASQAYYCVQKLEIPPEKVNVNGGAIALGHPLGATGTILVVKLSYEMKRRGAKWGIVSMCIGGGMGAAALFERV